MVKKKVSMSDTEEEKCRREDLGRRETINLRPHVLNDGFNVLRRKASSGGQKKKILGDIPLKKSNRLTNSNYEDLKLSNQTTDVRVSKSVSEFKVSSSDSESDDAVEDSEVSTTDNKPAVSTLQKFMIYFTDLRAESIMLFFAISNYLFIVFLQHFTWLQVCKRKFPFDDSICDNESAIEENVEHDIQRQVTGTLFYVMLIKTLPSVILLLFWGPWSDLHGRLLPTVTPLIGNILTLAICITWNEHVSWPMYVFLIAVVPSGLTGNYSCFMMGFYGWVNDAHSPELLSTKISVCNGVETLMVVLSPYLGRALLKSYNFTVLFATSIAFMCLACVLTFIFIKDRQYPSAPIKTLLYDMVNYRNVISILQVMWVKRKDNGRLHLNMILGSLIPICIAFFGHHDIVYLYLRMVAKFDVFVYTDYSSAQGVALAIGFLILGPILIEVAQLQDTTLGIISNLSFMAFYICTGIIQSKIALFTVCSLQILGAISLMTPRTYMSKHVDKTEKGKAMSLIGVAQAFGRNCGQIIASKMYHGTLHFFPGLFHIFGGSVLIITVLINVFIWIDMKRLSQPIDKNKTTNKN